eukprot:CAMPEP_0115884344 /NCGR_PEP_ID=MMETSP0287-20121206/30068_1 /TAXON_ID=412157 /ORGANISM="Chrysochromulina rotalis, Strain UIO044" /LENGTH=41 /DNA_ID= /DNA_START= /DNA_END= /DNA_ORIENTATION=
MTRTLHDAQALVDAFEAEHYSVVPTTHLDSHAVPVTSDSDL